MKYKYIINPDYEYLRKFIEKVPNAFDHEGVLVYDQRNQVRIFKEKGEKIVVKRFHRSLLPSGLTTPFSVPARQNGPTHTGSSCWNWASAPPRPSLVSRNTSWDSSVGAIWCQPTVATPMPECCAKNGRSAMTWLKGWLTSS